MELPEQDARQPEAAAERPPAAPRLAVLAAGPAEVEAYRSRLARFGASADCARDMAGLVRLMRDQPYNGVLLDLPTLIKDKSYDKRMVGKLTDLYPLVRVRHEAATGRVMALAADGAIGGEDVLETFVVKTCAAFAARPLRASERIPVCLYVEAGLEGEGAPEPCVAWGGGRHRTCVVDLGVDGCFLWAADPPAIGARVRLDFRDRPGEPVVARVVRRVPWGERPCPPGAGMKFEAVPDGVMAWFVSLGVAAE